MSISENREIVKKKAHSLVSKASSKLSKPEQKFLLEMIMGMLQSGSCNIHEIARNLKESTKLEYTTKRLERMLSHSHILKVCQ